MHLYTGRIIHEYKWEELLIDKYVISRVEELTANEKYPIIDNRLPCFKQDTGEEITDKLDKDIEDNTDVEHITLYNTVDRLTIEEDTPHQDQINDININSPIY